MPTRAKIKIIDNIDLRAVLDAEYETASQIKLCKYALLLAMHILEFIQFEDMNNAVIREGFLINEEWQKGNVRAHDVRQAGFKIHEIAKNCDDILTQAALRVVGHCIATGHMKEHAMVASDYAIKVINIKLPNDFNAIKSERLCQIELMNSIEDL